MNKLSFLIPYLPYLIGVLSLICTAFFLRKYFPRKLAWFIDLAKNDQLAAINFTLLFVGFTAHIFVLQFFGIITGWLWSLGISYAIFSQRNGDTPNARRFALGGGIFLKISQSWMEWAMLYSLIRQIDNFPFWSADFWTWATLISLLILDTGALIVKGKETADKAKKDAERAKEEAAAKAAKEEREKEERLERERLKILAEEKRQLAERKRLDQAEWRLIESERQKMEADLEKERIAANQREKENEFALERERIAAKERERQAEQERAERAEKERLERIRAEKAAKDEAERKAAKPKRQTVRKTSGKRNANWRYDLNQILIQIQDENGEMPTQKQLAEMCGASERSVREFLKLRNKNS